MQLGSFSIKLTRYTRRFKFNPGTKLNIFSPGASWAPKFFFPGTQPVFMPINGNLICNIVIIFFKISSTLKMLHSGFNVLFFTILYGRNKWGQVWIYLRQLDNLTKHWKITIYQKELYFYCCSLHSYLLICLCHCIMYILFLVCFSHLMLIV